MIESQYGRGSTFALDLDQREYWVTVKHILTGATHPPYGSIKSKTAQLRILNPGGEGEEWIPRNFSVLDPGVDIDIVVLAPSEPILTDPLPNMLTDSLEFMLGGDCEFLGFPHGGGWRATFDNGKRFWMPYVKHCHVSAFTQDMNKKIWVLDGINNPGFSGGPVTFRTGSQQKIVAVVSGYITEPTDVVPSVPASPAKPDARTVPKKSIGPHEPPHPKETVNLNSGFIVAFDISYAIEAIKKNPIGPLRRAK
jgi:hypothetical protein